MIKKFSYRELNSFESSGMDLPKTEWSGVGVPDDEVVEQVGLVRYDGFDVEGVAVGPEKRID